MNRSTLTRRTLLKTISQGALTLPLLTSCMSPSMPQEQPITTVPTPVRTDDVSLETKIGQMLMVGFRGLAVGETDPIVQDIQERHLGGVVLFDYDVLLGRFERNIQSPAQVTALNRSLQSFAQIPLLVAIDYEGGIITRLRESSGFPATLSHQALGETNDPQQSYQQGLAMAQTLTALGINLNLAPVVDVNTNVENPIIAAYERSFSANPNAVADHALAFIEAHHEAGALCTLKHFPGHGSSTEDSHLGMVDVTDTWSAIELEPYARVIEAGRADAIMTAHVFNSKLDPERPATLSAPIITGLLRGELGYDGVVISDDMQMKSIALFYGYETAIQKTIEAGVDIIAIANNLNYEPNITAQTVDLIQQFVADGVISEARIDESYQRILRLKKKLS